MLKRSLLLLAALAGCRAVAAPTDGVAPISEAAQRAAAPAQDVELAVAVVRLQHLSADMLACWLSPRRDSRGVVRWSENRYCAMRPQWEGPVITPPDDAAWKQHVSKRAPAPPEAPWSVDVLAQHNALVIRGTPAQVASLRQRVLFYDRRD